MSQLKKNAYEQLSREELLKKRDLLKGITIGFGVLYLLVIGVVLYLTLSKGFKSLSIPTLIPLFLFPVMLLPLAINMSVMNKELASRKG